MKILINASNLNGGGAVQVATSYLVELIRLNQASKYDVLLSSVVFENLCALNVDLNCFNNFEVENNYGFKFLFSIRQFKLLKYDLVFTIFGPLYCILRLKKSLVGFAQPNIIYPEVSSLFNRGVFLRLFGALKYSIQKIFYLKSTALIVELDHVQQRLRRIRGFGNHQIFIVRNAINSFFLNHVLTKVNKCDGIFRIGFLSKFYPHKNHMILVEVAEILKKKYKFSNFEFHLTIDDQDFRRLGFSDHANFINHGSLRLDQCINFYDLIDCVFFPSLLECFSASPIEALIMKKILVASDRDFVRDIVGNYALYFEPESAESGADALWQAININNDDKYFQNARDYAIGFSSASDRAISYNIIIDKLLRG